MTSWNAEFNILLISCDLSLLDLLVPLSANNWSAFSLASCRSSLLFYSDDPIYRIVFSNVFTLDWLTLSLKTRLLITCCTLTLHSVRSSFTALNSKVKNKSSQYRSTISFGNRSMRVFKISRSWSLPSILLQAKFLRMKFKCYSIRSFSRG